MTAIIARALATAVAVALLAIIAANAGPALPDLVVVPAAAALIPLAAVAWWAVGLAAYSWHRHPRNTPLLEELDNLVRSATASTTLAFIGANYLLGSPLPRGAGIVLLLAGVLLYQGRLVKFVVRFYRR
jgi:hypothetical protein